MTVINLKIDEFCYLVIAVLVVSLLHMYNTIDLVDEEISCRIVRSLEATATIKRFLESMSKSVHNTILSM